MSETRRQLFKKTVLTAIATSSAAALAACTRGATFLGGPSLKFDPGVPILGRLGSYWYIFEYDAGKDTFRVYKTVRDIETADSVVPNVAAPIDPAYIPFDTLGWVSSLNLTDNDFVKKATFTIETWTFTTDGNGYLTAGSENLKAYAKPLNGAWNEIGQRR